MNKFQIPLLSLVFVDKKELQARYFTENQCFMMKYHKALKKLFREKYLYQMRYSDFRIRLLNILCDYVYYEDMVQEIEKKKVLRYVKRKCLEEELEKARLRNY